MTLIDRVPKRIWMTGGVVLALCGGVAAASAGAHAIAHGDASSMEAERNASGGRLLKVAFAAPAPLVLPPAPAEADRLAVLAPPPENLANLDPDLQQSASYAALDASMKRYEAQLGAEATAADARPMPIVLTSAASPSPLEQPARTAAARPPAAGDDDLAASGDTGPVGGVQQALETD